MLLKWMMRSVKKSLLLTLIFTAGFSALLLGQETEVKIHGKIMDESGNPIEDATVRDLNNNNTVKSDASGYYELYVHTDTIRIEVSHVEFQSQIVHPEVTGNEEPVNIILQKQNKELDEVIVTGQGMDVRKRRLASNVTTIKAGELENIPSTRFDQLLQSKLPNAQIRLTGGQSGATSIIRARGVTSAFVNSTPIIYVDGVRMDNLNTVSELGGGSAQGAAISSIADIPMDNIERVEYINGGAATTLFGSDAANGVIQIFTKKGGEGEPRITAEAQMGVEKSTNDFLYFKGTKDLLFETGVYQKYNVSVNGGNNKSGYSFSGSYLNNSGVMLHKQNRNRKMDFSSGFRASLGKRVTYESSFTFVNNQYKRNRNGNQGGYTGLWFAESGASAITGPRFDNKIDELTDSAFQAMKAYVNEAERLQDDQININRFTTSQSFKYNALKNLVIKATGGIDYRVMRDQVIQTNQYLTHTTGQPVTDQGTISNNERKYMSTTLELNAQHTWNTGDFSLITTGGGQLFRTNDHQVSYTGTNIRDGARVIQDAAVKTSNEFYGEMFNYGIYLQENLGFKNKLFLDLGIRGDGNPSFGENIGVQYYPKAGFSWIISEEPWFENLSDILSSARLRGSFGIAGNLPPSWANERTITIIGFLGDQAAFFGQPGNDNLKPEKTQTTDAGIDLSFLKDRIRFSAGYYRSITRDALFYVPATPSSGQTQSQLYNVGEILNRGWEFSTVLTPVKSKHWTTNINFSINTLHNRVVNSGGVAPFNINGFSARTIQTVVEQGYPVGYIRGSYGTFNQEGVLENTVPQSYLGTTIPDVFGSAGLSIQYKKLQFFANADYQSGAYANNWDAQFRFNYGASNSGIPQGEIDQNGRLNWLSFTNRFIEKTDFIKVRTIGILYTVQPHSDNNAVKGATIGFSIVNPLNFAASSFDPEATISGSAQGQGGATTGGVSYATYSAPRQFIGSVRFNF